VINKMPDIKVTNEQNHIYVFIDKDIDDFKNELVIDEIDFNKPVELHIKKKDMHIINETPDIDDDLVDLLDEFGSEFEIYIEDSDEIVLGFIVNDTNKFFGCHNAFSLLISRILNKYKEKKISTHQ